MVSPIAVVAAAALTVIEVGVTLATVVPGAKTPALSETGVLAKAE